MLPQLSIQRPLLAQSGHSPKFLTIRNQQAASLTSHAPVYRACSNPMDETLPTSSDLKRSNDRILHFLWGGEGRKTLDWLAIAPYQELRKIPLNSTAQHTG